MDRSLGGGAAGRGTTEREATGHGTARHAPAGSDAQRVAVQFRPLGAELNRTSGGGAARTCGSAAEPPGSQFGGGAAGRGWIAPWEGAIQPQAAATAAQYSRAERHSHGVIARRAAPSASSPRIGAWNGTRTRDIGPSWPSR